MEGLKLVFEILAALGSIGTFGAFVMLFIKDKQKQEQIDKLTDIVDKLTNITGALEIQNDVISKQIDLGIMPELWTNGVKFDANGLDFKIDLSNRGEIANLLEFKLISEDITLNNEHLPYDLENGKSRYIFCQSKGKKHNECFYAIIVVYADKRGTKYQLVIQPKNDGIPKIISNGKLL